MAGKSEFLRNEGRNALIGASRETPGTSYYAFCDLDIGRRRNLRPINVFLLLRQALAAASVKTPRLDHGLARYNEITGGGFARANPRMDWGDLMRRRAEAASAAIDVGGAVLAAAVGAGMGAEADMAVAGAVEIGIAVGKKALEGELELRRSDARRREDIDRELSSPDLREISANLYKYLMYDIEALDGPLCLVLDSLESFFDYQEDACLKLLDALAGAKDSVFLVLAGRRGPLALSSSDCVRVDLGSVESGPFASALNACGVPITVAWLIARNTSASPGLGIILARDFRADVKLLKASLAAYEKEPEGNLFSLLKRALKASLEELEPSRRRHVETLSWFERWREDGLPKIHALEDYDGSEVRTLSYVRAHGGECAMHSLVAAAIRDICSDDAVERLEADIQERLGDYRSTASEIGTEEKSDLISALAMIAAERTRRSARDLCNEGILRSNPLVGPVSLSSCGDVLDVIRAQSYSDINRGLVDDYLEVFQFYSEMELRYALLYEYADPTFSFQKAQDAVNACSRIVEFASTWFYSGGDSEAARNAHLRVMVSYADRLRRFAAIATEVYKLTSDYSYQVKSMQYEIEAADITVGYICTLGNQADGKDLTELCNVLNAISVSLYRLRRYDVCLPLREMFCALIDHHGDMIDNEAKARALRNGGAAYLAYARDYSKEGTSHADERQYRNLKKLAADIDGALTRGIELCTRSIAIDDRWDAMITRADCKFEQAVRGCSSSDDPNQGFESAIDDLLLVKKDIEWKGKTGHVQYARCLQRLAAAYERYSSVDAPRKKELLSRALEMSELAGKTLKSIHQTDDHVDVVKNEVLRRRLKDELGL